MPVSATRRRRVAGGESGSADARRTSAEEERPRPQANGVSARLSERAGEQAAGPVAREAAVAALERAHSGEAAETDKAIAAVARRVMQVLSVLDTSRHELAARLARCERALQEQSAELQRRTDEVAALTRLLYEAECAAARRAAAATPVRPAAAGRGWLYSRASALVTLARRLSKPIDRRVARILRQLRLRRQVADLRRSGLFDAQWYLREYGDVARAGMDPMRHYVEFGLSEGRAPNPSLAAPRGEPRPAAGRN